MRELTNGLSEEAPCMDHTRCPGLEEAFKEQDTSQDDLTNDETLDRRCEAESWQPWNFHWPSALGTSRSRFPFSL